MPSGAIIIITTRSTRPLAMRGSAVTTAIAVETRWLSGYRVGFWICRSQVQIPAVTLFRHVITLSISYTLTFTQAN